MHYIGDPYNMWIPTSIAFEGIVEFNGFTELPNGKFLPAGAERLYWDSPIGGPGTATVGPFQSAMTLFGPPLPGQTQPRFSAWEMTGMGQMG